MTTPPITRRCPFCGAPESFALIDSEQRHSRSLRFVSCLNCNARGPTNAYDNEQRQIAAAVFDWENRPSTLEWRTDEAARRYYAKRDAFIDKWAAPTPTTTPTTTTNHQPKGKTTTR